MITWYSHELEIEGMPGDQWAELIGSTTDISAILMVHFQRGPTETSSLVEWEKTNLSIAKGIEDASAEDLCKQFQGHASKIRNKLESMPYEDFKKYIDSQT